MAQLALTVVGNSVGGPLGAMVGSQIGASIDAGWMGRPSGPDGPRLSDLTIQVSSYGQPIPRIFGAENRAAGNVIWSTGIREAKTEAMRGKGAPPTGATFAYDLDCAVAVCRGPIARIGRIWADGKLWRDEAGVFKGCKAVRVYLGTEDQLPDPAMQAALTAARCPAHRGVAYVLFEGLQLEPFGNRLPVFTFEVVAHESATVATVIEELCEAAGVPFLDAARADFLDLRGYALARPSTVRGALEPLRTAYAFDVSEQDGELCFFPADAPPVARVPRHQLGAHPFGTDRPPDYEAKRIADVELPRQVVVQHRDPARDYQPNAQRARRATVLSEADVSADMPMVLTGSEAKALAERLLSTAWLQRVGFSFTLPIEFMGVQPGHKLVADTADGRARVLRVTRRELRLPGVVAVEVVTDGTAALNQLAVAAPALVPTQEVLLPGVTVAHFLDLPILRDADDAPGCYLAAGGASRGWAGTAVLRSLDGGASFAAFAAAGVGAVIGTAVAALPPASPAWWDEASSVEVELLDARDALESVAAEDVLNGRNLAVIGGELVGFRAAELVGPARYRLSGLLRGRRGTEDAIGAHAAGERFVLLTGGGIGRPVFEAAETGVARQFKAVSIGTLAEDAVAFTFAHGARWAKPYAPVHARGARDAGGNLAIGWTRRTRLEAPWADATDAPLGETSEAYAVDVLDGSGAVKRTIAATSPSVTYPAADQAGDFGSPQVSVRLRIYQVSARVGRGLPLEAIL